MTPFLVRTLHVAVVASVASPAHALGLDAPLVAELTVKGLLLIALGIGFLAGIGTGLTTAHPASGLWITTAFLFIGIVGLLTYGWDGRDFLGLVFMITVASAAAGFVLAIPTVLAYFGGYLGSALLREWLVKRRSRAAP